MMKMWLNKQTGFGKVQVGMKIYTVVKADGLWNLSCSDYSGKYLVEYWIAENKKRLSTIKKHAEKYGIEIED